MICWHLVPTIVVHAIGLGCFLLAFSRDIRVKKESVITFGIAIITLRNILKFYCTSSRTIQPNGETRVIKLQNIAWPGNLGITLSNRPWTGIFLNRDKISLLLFIKVTGTIFGGFADAAIITDKLGAVTVWNASLFTRTRGGADQPVMGSSNRINSNIFFALIIECDLYIFL